ncbi:hypothetical protein [Motilimonas pumila]|uniref:Uncharacterized protein n=1 Tax=Motilimonas pumila TaxID=2303987 RepID=A0A418Y9L7_9GAMM|nr:hypothetical protein [Motilimonas pumila]RJG37758.1 hypothetical protein D1Z90_19590 [Motilimonas pumila]
MSNHLDILTTSPYAVKLPQAFRQEYEALHRVQSLWIDACQSNGCQVFSIGQQTARHIVITNRENLPNVDEIEIAASRLKQGVLKLASKQGKSLNIGARALHPLQWYSAQGRFGFDDMPDHAVSKIHITHQTAYRGKYQPASEALTWMKDKQRRLTDTIETYRNNFQYQRLTEAEKQLEQLEQDTQSLNAIFKEHGKDSLLYKFKSGLSEKYRFYDQKGNNYRSSVARIALVYAHSHLHLEQAKPRSKPSQHHHLVDLGNLCLYKKRAG